jgi:tetratricopeptide (TPR) repeat protein
MSRGWPFSWLTSRSRDQGQTKKQTQELLPEPSPPAPFAEPSAEDKAHRYASQGDRARDLGNWSEAAQQYALALEQRPNWPDIRVQYGHALKESGRLLEAEDAYRRAAGEAADPADALLQLGHALKLQRRYVEAEEAYFASLSHDPNSPHALAELLALGVAPTVLDSHIAAVGVKHDPLTTDPQHSDMPREILIERPPGRMHGRITAVTTTSIRGEILEIPPDVSPVIVCRHGRETLCVIVLERDAEMATMPTDQLDFEIQLPSDVTELLSISLEPEGRPLFGSPVIPLGKATASLLERIAKIESQIGQGSLEATIEKRLERRLIAGATYGVATHVERLLNRQRTLFERQLVTAGSIPRFSRDLPLSIWTTEASHSTRVLLDASEGFGGLGWSAPEVNGGCFSRWMGRHAFVEMPFPLSRTAVMKATIASVASPHLLYGLRVSIASTFVPSWIEPHPSDPAAWIWTALLPADKNTSENISHIALHADDSVAVRGTDKRHSIAIRDIEFAVTSITERAKFRIDGGSFWLLKGWKRSEIAATPRPPRSTVLLPTLMIRESAHIILEGMGLASIEMVVLNETILPVQKTDESQAVFLVNASDWSTDLPNELSISWHSTGIDINALISSIEAKVTTSAHSQD